MDANFLAHRAIAAAFSASWEEAVKINRQILKIVKDDVEALNRLALAQTCLGKILAAQRTYKKVLEIDPYNVIAKRNLEKLAKSNGKGNGAVKAGSNGYDLAKLFLFEPGKTKLINLLNLAPPAVLATLNCGDQLLVNAKNHAVLIATVDKVYLGALPDDLAHRLIFLIAAGNQYDAYVKSATPKLLTIFIREIYRAPKLASQPSFQANQNFYSEG